MIRQIMKALLLCSVPVFASSTSGIAAANSQSHPTVVNRDELNTITDLQVFKKQRDLEVQRIREEIFTIRPALKSDRSNMAKKVIDRKVRNVREKEFLSAEFQKGIHDLYARAMARFADQDYENCRFDFEEIERLSPGFKETRSYLKKLAAISKSQKSAQLAGLKEEKK